MGHQWTRMEISTWHLSWCHMFSLVWTLWTVSTCTKCHYNFLFPAETDLKTGANCWTLLVISWKTWLTCKLATAYGVGEYWGSKVKALHKKVFTGVCPLFSWTPDFTKTKLATGSCGACALQMYQSLRKSYCGLNPMSSPLCCFFSWNNGTEWWLLSLQGSALAWPCAN